MLLINYVKPEVSNTYIENSQFWAGRLLMTRAFLIDPMQPLRCPALVPPADEDVLATTMPEATSECALRTQCAAAGEI